MNEQAINEGVARRFLLGQLPPEEQGRIEELAFQDPDTFAFLQSAEDDLVDDFLYDELSPEEKELFGKNFLSKPGRRQNVRIARAMKQYLGDDVPSTEIVAAAAIDSHPRPSFLQWFRLGALTAPLVIAAILITTGLGVFVAIKVSKSGDGTEQARTQPSPVPTPSSSPAASPVPSASSPAPPENQNKPTPAPRQSSGPIYAILTPTASVRSENEVSTLARPTGPITIELPVISVTSYRSYQALLQTDEKTVHTWSNLRTRRLSSGNGVQITILPGQLAGSQRYRIVLNGVLANGQTQTVHNYHFQLAE